MDFRFRPAFLEAVHGYRRDDFAADVGADLTVARVAMPLAMAFDIARGVKPEQGLITAVVGGLIVSALEGSRVPIAGPAGAFVAADPGGTQQPADDVAEALRLPPGTGSAQRLRVGRGRVRTAPTLTRPSAIRGRRPAIKGRLGFSSPRCA